MGNLLQKSWAATPEIQAKIQALARLELHRRRDQIKKDSLGPTNVIKQRILDGLLEYQQPICEDFDHRIIGFCAGYGAGKTRTMCAWATLCALDNPNTVGALFAPTGSLVRDVSQRSLEDFWDTHGIRYTYRASPLPEYELDLPSGNVTILCRSMENWQRIVGVNLSFIGSDEIDTTKPELAQRAIEKFLGRLRAGKRRQLGLFSTPEGFGTFYNLFVREGDRTDRQLYKARTADNPYLPPDFLQALLENYPAGLVKAYTEGEFCNLTTGQVYDRFNREKHVTTEIPDVSRDIIRIGIDFNIDNMSAVIGVVQKGELFIFDEISGEHDTDSLAREIRRRFPHNTIYGYPDASGGARATNAAKTDIQILDQYKIQNMSGPSNPYVRDRVAAVQALLENGKGIIRFHVSPKCEKVIECLELQSYTEKGEPDKEAGYDHMNDALGYLIWREFNPLHMGTGRRTGVRIY
mgnify:FL=1